VIRRARGVAVIAHPVSLKLPPPELRALLRELEAAGLGGVEAYYPEHPRPMVLLCRALAEEIGLAVTGGSDYHGAATPRIQMGRGLGTLEVPDEVLDQLAARRPSRPDRSS
jgi:predicted metal-dependent phosphoesterase TrpH